MSDTPRWEAQTRNGRRYYRFLQNGNEPFEKTSQAPLTDLLVGIGQLRYRLDDGRTLTQHEFDELPDLR
jgi:hypothetical protein